MFRTNCLKEHPMDSTQTIYGFPGLTSLPGRGGRQVQLRASSGIAHVGDKVYSAPFRAKFVLVVGRGSDGSFMFFP